MFTVQFHSGGVLRQTCNGVPAYDHRGMLRIPNYAVLAPSLAPRVREALQRANWEQVYSDLLKADLRDRRGRPIGTLTAQWKALPETIMQRARDRGDRLA